MATKNLRPVCSRAPTLRPLAWLGLFCLAVNMHWAQAGTLIIDATASPNGTGVYTNMDTQRGSATFGGRNAFSSDNLHIIRSQEGELWDYVGIDSNPGASYTNGSIATRKLNYFKNGGHMLDLARYRNAASWLSKQKGVVGTYGAISWKQFLDNARAGTTMYGLVRVQIPLSKGGCDHCSQNALGASVSKDKLYWYCDKHDDSCLAANTHISAENGSTAHIRVKGTLMFDFVDEHGGSIGLDSLPASSGQDLDTTLGFSIEVPISINAANDGDNDGIMDNLSDISHFASSAGTTFLDPTSYPIGFSDVPAAVIALYPYQHGGTTLSAAVFNAMPHARQYHTLMPSGYAQGWKDAFDALGVSAKAWNKNAGFLLYDSGGTAVSLADILNEQSEDLPALISTGGLLKINSHVNITGLIYIPQALALAQQSADRRQYIAGGVVVRDGFSISQDGLTVMTRDDDSTGYVRIKSSVLKGFTPVGNNGLGSGYGLPDRALDAISHSDDNAPTAPTRSGDDGVPTGAVLETRWVEIRPQV